MRSELYAALHIKVTTNPTTKDTINNQKLSNNKISTTRPYLVKISIDMDIFLFLLFTVKRLSSNILN
jgi:hypothetical protein